MSLDALRSLQEQASPGEWEAIGPVDEAHAKALEANDALTCWVYDTQDEVATFDANELQQNFANAKLVAVSKNHLLPIAEALEAVPCFFECPGLESECGNDKCLRCSALKALTEALE